MECAVYALEGVSWNWMPGDRGGGSLMGKGTMVCGDTLMFNHKWPPDAGSHKPAPLLITAALNRVHCTLFSEHLCKPPPLPTSVTLQPQSNPFVRGKAVGCAGMIQCHWAKNKNPNPDPSRAEGRALWSTGLSEQRGPNRVRGGRGGLRTRPRQHGFCHEHLKHSLMTQMIDTSNVGRKKVIWFDIWKVITAPHPHRGACHWCDSWRDAGKSEIRAQTFHRPGGFPCLKPWCVYVSCLVAGLGYNTACVWN